MYDQWEAKSLEMRAILKRPNQGSLKFICDSRWVNGKDGAIDVTVTSPLSPSNVMCAAAEPGGALKKAHQRKVKDTAEACRLEGIVFLPFAVETLGGLHSGAVAQVRQLAAALARCKGVEEGEVKFLAACPWL